MTVLGNMPLHLGIMVGLDALGALAQLLANSAPYLLNHRALDVLQYLKQHFCHCNDTSNQQHESQADTVHLYFSCCCCCGCKRNQQDEEDQARMPN